MSIALGIETSCDDTSVSLVKDTGEVLFLKNQDQNEIHQKYGGIVPELASRNHSKYLLPLIEEALKIVPQKDIDVIGVTNRPGLLGALLVGCLTAKTLSMAWDKPLVGVNHIEAHIFSSYLWSKKSLNQKKIFPSLALVVSGGHSSLFYVKDIGQSLLLGSTLDDAAGEALDKFAKLLGFPWPGGPCIDEEAQKSKQQKDFFTQIKTDKLNFSFSGLKSLGQRFLSQHKEEWIQENKSDICESYQRSVVNHLLEKLKLAFKKYPVQNLLVGGGVTANSFLKSSIKEWTKSQGITCYYPEKQYCTDNASMIAWTGLQYFLKGKVSSLDLSTSPRALEEDFFTNTVDESLINEL